MLKSRQSSPSWNAPPMPATSPFRSTNPAALVFPKQVGFDHFLQCTSTFVTFSKSVICRPHGSLAASQGQTGGPPGRHGHSGRRQLKLAAAESCWFQASEHALWCYSFTLSNERLINIEIIERCVWWHLDRLNKVYISYSISYFRGSEYWQLYHRAKGWFVNWKDLRLTLLVMENSQLVSE